MNSLGAPEDLSETKEENRRNKKKHGVSFELAASVFNDPHALSVRDVLLLKLVRSSTRFVSFLADSQLSTLILGSCHHVATTEITPLKMRHCSGLWCV
jgi:hypothetical protein